MRKDTTEFRQRFQRWKAGEQVYDKGRPIPHYEDGSDGTTYKVGVPGVDYDYSNIAWENTLDPVVVTGNKPKTEKPYWVSAKTKQLQPSELMAPLSIVGEAIDQVPVLGPTFNEYVAPVMSLGNWISGKGNPWKGAEIRANDERQLGAWLPFDFIGIKGVKSYLNKESLLNKNIRTALYNNKMPFGYNIFDINIPKSFAEGLIKSMGNIEIPQMTEPKWFKYKKVANDFGIPEGQSLKDPRTLNNRAAAWARYLGLDDNLQGSGYIESRPGWVTKPHDPYFKKAYADEIKREMSKNGGKSKGVISDKSIYNTAGNMGYEITNGVARVYDTWDLQPLKKFNIPFIKNFEASQILPGAKPFNFEMFVDMNR